MRLLFDQNLSSHLSVALHDLYPESVHVRDVGLVNADDFSIWAYAREHGLVIVSKDSDFRQMSFTYGHPAKVLWIRRGNCATSEIESILRTNFSDLIEFHDDEIGAFLALN